jgi:parvulin-like peptidyl-prolyl isomerase
MLERMVLTRILLQRATDEDKAKAKELADKFIADTKKKAPSEESYRRQLIATGLKPEVFEARALEQAIVEKVVEREIKSKLTVTDAQIRDFYEQGLDVNTREIEAAVKAMEKNGNQDTVFYRDGTNRLAEVKRVNLGRLDRPEIVKAGLILLYTVDKATREPLSEEQFKAKKDLAEKTIKRLQSGEDFTKVAQDVSEDPDLIRTAGEYNVTRETPMASELLTTIFTTPANQVCDVPVVTRNGLYVVVVKEKKPAGKMPLDQAEKEIRELLLAQGVEKQLPAHADALKKEYEVQVLVRNKPQ